MKDITKAIIGGVAIFGLAITGYRAYNLKKLQSAVQEEQIIDIEPEKVEEARK